MWRPLQATKVTSHLDYYLCFSLYSTVGHIGGSYVCYILCTKTLWYSNKVIESNYYAFHCYFIGDYRMGLPPRKGEAGKQPISSFKSKVIRISNSVWLSISNSTRQNGYPNFTCFIIILVKCTSHLIKALGEVCVILQSPKCMNIKFRTSYHISRSDHTSVLRNIYSAVFTPAEFKWKYLSLKHFYLWVRHLEFPSLLVHKLS